MKKNLAINVITKDNEPGLEKCLSSVQELNPEYIIVFNGKSSSIEHQICKKYAPDSTFYLPWNNDFSEQRNFAISKTKADWIIWLDSDEFIPPKSVSKIKELVESGPKGFYHNFKLIQEDAVVGQIRMFYNRPENKFSFPVHERLIPTEYPINHQGITVIHENTDAKDSSDRNIGILTDELEKDPNNPHLNFYLAIEYHLIDKQMKALISAEKFLYHYPVKDVDIRKMYIRYLIAWINTYTFKNYQKAIEILLSQLILNCNIAEFWCLLGDIYFRLKRFSEAKRFYQNAVKMGEFKYENLWLVDTTKYQAYPLSRIGLCEKHLELDLNSFNQKLLSPIVP